jgi:N-acetylneuraminic acid mutarotase
MRMINCLVPVSSTALNKVTKVLDSLEKWREIPPMKSPRSTGFSLIFKSKIYVFGGYTGEKKRSKMIEVYDPIKNYWECLNVTKLIFRLNFIAGSKLALSFLSSQIKS